MQRYNFWKLLQNYKINFPLIQRDYAQGRTDHHSTAVRRHFIYSLLQAVRNYTAKKPLMLGFIFGKSIGDQFIPYDGQQRICTLFLLYLYAAVKDGAFKEEAIRKVFHKLTYEAREELSSFLNGILRAFADNNELNKLILTPEPGPLIAAYIKKQTWFSPIWHLDQSICGFLVTLDEIRQTFAKYEELWNVLNDEQSPPIQFYFADIDDFDASADDLFIKMNSRGKSLGQFEKFKASFLELLKWEEAKKAEDIARKLDTVWQDLFWKACGKSYDGDKVLQTELCFYNFLTWLASILFHLSKAKSDYVFMDRQPPDVMIAALQRNLTIFSLENVMDSLALLEKCKGIAKYLDSIFLIGNDENMPQLGKISLYRKMDMFKEICLKGKIDRKGSLLFFAFLLQLISNFKNIDPARDDVPAKLLLNSKQLRQLRMIRNLIENSRNELANANIRQQLECISKLFNEEILHSSHVFNNFQLAEEKAKMDARSQDPAISANLEWLEDHPLLRGCIAIFSERTSYRNKLKFSAAALETGKKFFERALGENPLAWDKLLQGLLSQNIFGLREGSQPNKYFYLAKEDNEGRRRIFTTARADCFSEIRDAVQKLSEKIGADNGFSMESIIGKIVHKWIEKRRQEGKMDWRWYFVAYPEILPAFSQTDGYYDWNYSWRSFEQRQLRKQIMKGPHKNPFLWAVYVEAGFCDSDKNKARAIFREESGRGKDNPIAFPASRLGLWGGELYWRVNSISGKLIGKKQLPILDDLRQRLADKGINMNSEGYCFIPGKDSRKWSHNHFSLDETQDVIRRYDSQDRVELGKTIALEMLKLA